MPVGEGYFTSMELAEVLHVDRSTILRLISVGRLKAFEISPRGDKRIPRDELLAYMKRQNIPLGFLDRYEADRSKRRVLVIEDNKAYAARVADAIAAEDRRIEAKIARTAGEGALLMGEFRPHLLVINFGLPDMTADRLLESVREKRKEIGAKVILVSARSKTDIARGEELEEKMRRLGVDEFFYKFEQLSTVRETALAMLGLEERRRGHRPYLVAPN